MITKFGDAVNRAIKAGFDGVEIHGANTYLIADDEIRCGEALRHFVGDFQHFQREARAVVAAAAPFARAGLRALLRRPAAASVDCRHPGSDAVNQQIH
jgi:hypothetical protein